ncbi:MAG: hypothetical protein WAL21_01070 [Nitrososphaeraceae archaeon]
MVKCKKRTIIKESRRFHFKFKNSVSTLDELATTENLGTINKTQIIIEEFNNRTGNRTTSD